MIFHRRFFTVCALASCFGAAALLFGCGGSPPELLQLFWQKNVVLDRELDTAYETMSLWINGSDEDGTEDFEYLYLIHDEEELFWELTDETWMTDERGGGYWVGTNEIIMHGRSDFPSGNYRAVLIDAAGERDERRFFVTSGPAHAELVFPRLIPGTEWEFRSPHRENLLWVYGSGGGLIGTYSVEGGRFDPAELIGGNVRAEEDRRETKDKDKDEEGRSELPESPGSGPLRFEAYAYDDGRGVGLISGPYEYLPSTGD